MPIALSPIQLSQSLQTPPIVAGGGDHGGRPIATRAGAGATPVAPTVEKEPPQGEVVSLSAANSATSGAYVPAAPYAEIWKDGRKVATIDSRGDVNSFGGLIAAPLGGGSGISLAAQRAVAIARSVGGEIRVAGMVTDVATLTMSARLRETYGS